MVVKCGLCHQAAELVTGKEIYTHVPRLHDRKYWLCRDCNAYVGTHENSHYHKPLGSLANGVVDLLTTWQSAPTTKLITKKE